jgi:hypothetical protein
MTMTTTHSARFDAIAASLGFHLLYDMTRDTQRLALHLAEQASMWGEHADLLRTAAAIASSLDHVERHCTNDAERCRVMVWCLTGLPAPFRPDWDDLLSD